MIEAVVVALLACVALVYVTNPLRRVPHEQPLREGPTPVEEAQERKVSALSAIVDLEEEAAVGKLTIPELEALREGYEREALAALAQLDALAAPAPADDPLEVEIAAMRKRLACPSCGALRDHEGTCSRCDA